MYAITFDLVISDLEKYYPKRYTRAYQEIKEILKKGHFYWIQGSVYISNSDLKGLFKAMENLKKIDWFRKCVRDIRAFRIEEFSDFTTFFKEE